MKHSLNCQQEGIELLTALVEKAWENPSFKTQLIGDPIATIEYFTGKQLTLPKEKKIVIEDQTDSSIVYLNLFAEPDISEIELTEEQLQMIAGGITPSVIPAAYVGGFIIGAGATLLAGYLLS